MKQIISLLFSVSLALGAAAQTTKVVEMNFQKPSTISPPTAAPTVPDDPTQRDSYIYSYIDGVELSSGGVTLTVKDGIHNEGETARHSYTWRKGYDDNGVKRTENTDDGTYYLEIRTSDNDDVVATDPTQQMKLTVAVPAGSTIRKIEIPGQSVLNSCEYLKLTNADDGSMVFDSSTFVSTFTAAEGKDLQSVTFTCPRKKDNGVNMAPRKIYKMFVTVEENEAPVETKTAVFDFTQPSTITPSQYAPVVPETDRESRYEVDINGVTFKSSDVSFTVNGGLIITATGKPSNLYTWRKGYNPDGTKNTDNPQDGRYYISLSPSAAEDVLATDPSQQSVFSVAAPTGYFITEVTFQGDKANSVRYFKLIDSEAGTGTNAQVEGSQLYEQRFLPKEGTKPVEMKFTIPRKRDDGVNISGAIANKITVVLEKGNVPEPDPEGLPIPYNRLFKSDNGLDGMTVLDANNDGYSWEYNLSWARCTGPLGDDNPNTEGNDWLITPGLAMYGGKYYKVYTPFTPQYGTPGKVELKLGTSADPEDMTIEVMPATEFDSRMDCVNYVKVPKNGTYYLGVHCVTPRGAATYTRLQSIDIYEPMPATAPAAVTDFKASPASDGEKPYKVEISFKAPSVDLDGNPLTENLEKVVIGNGTYAGNALSTVSKTFENVAPGQELSYTYTQKGTGYRVFGVVAYNASGIGAETYSKSVYVGVNKPTEPTDMAITETGTPGEVTISWKAPEVDIDGNPLNADLVTYSLTDCLTYRPIANDVKGTSYTYQTGLTDTQQFFRFAITAKTDGGTTMSTESPYVAVGKALATPLTEGFERLTAMPLDFENNDGRATIFHDNDMTGAKKPYSAEGDGHYVTLYAYNSEAHPSMLTAKISLAGLTSPVLAFNMFAPVLNNGDRTFSGNELVVKAGEPGGEMKELGKFRIADLAADGWNRIVCPLGDFAGKDVQFLFEGNLNDWPNGEDSQSFLFFDRMQVRENPAGTDLAAINLDTPAVAEQSYEFPVRVYVENDGAAAVEQASVELYRNGELADSKDVKSLVPGQIEIVELPQILGATDGKDVVYKAVVVLESDAVESNNATAEKTVDYKTSMHPAPEALAGTADKNAVTLSWQAPSLPGGTAETVTEDFEIEGKFAVDELEGWTFYDLDKGTLGLPTGMVLEGLTEGKTQYAWIIADESLFGAEGMAYSGTHFMTGFFNYDGRTNNDIAVSPELNGKAQEISFYAVSFASKYPETIDVWASKGTRDVADFERVDAIPYVSAAWTKYTFNLPEGTRFFAIRHVSSDAWFVGVDDVTFTPMEPGKDVELLGYNIYRDGQKVNSDVIADTTYLDEAMDEGKHSYAVSCVYDKGESLACAPVEVSYSSVGGIVSGNLVIKGAHGCILVNSSELIKAEVFTASGVKIADETCGEGLTRIPAEPGIYMVRTGSETTKVAVK